MLTTLRRLGEASVGVALGTLAWRLGPAQSGETLEPSNAAQATNAVRNVEETLLLREHRVAQPLESGGARALGAPLPERFQERTFGVSSSSGRVRARDRTDHRL